jgi:hypothetical protein
MNLPTWAFPMLLLLFRTHTFRQNVVGRKSRFGTQPQPGFDDVVDPAALTPSGSSESFGGSEKLHRIHEHEVVPVVNSSNIFVNGMIRFQICCVL